MAAPLPSIPFDTIRAWFFDLDGTLMDTDDQSVERLAHRLRFLGPARSHRLARRIVMMSETPMNSVATALDMVGVDPLAFALQRLLRGGAPYDFRMVAGVRPLLDHLAARYPLAVVSTRSRGAALAFLAQHALGDHFREVVTQESTRRLKPHPEPIRFAAAALELAPEDCIMVGDTTVDIHAARRAGAWAVGVLCGFGEEDELRRAGAHLILPSTSDLLEIVQGGA
jgi:HAD superfamily hydrolase (TIGR01509 family)